MCSEKGIKWHSGKVFSTDSIFAEFAHLDEILSFDCNFIEMETAAAFRAAKLANIPVVALLSVSDNVMIDKSLLGGRNEEEMNYYRKYVRREIFPQILLGIFKDYQ
ncbi:MAG: hypothetical protein ACE3NC_08660 [Candidatus Wallacebacter cryptica]|nr:hypothetical protein [Bacillota bacterium]